MKSTNFGPDIQPHKDLAHNKMARLLAQVARPLILLEAQTGLFYERQDSGTWAVTDLYRFEAICQNLLDYLKGEYSRAYFNSVIGLAKPHLLAPEWETDKNLLPMQNGVLNIQNREITDYTIWLEDPKVLDSDGKPKQYAEKELYFNWQLPFAYDADVTCPFIDEWFEYLSDGNHEIKDTLLCVAAAVLTRRHDLHKYIVFIGAGGTGKSTFIRFVEKLIGERNVWTTSLRELEYDKYEASNIYGKALVTITDAEEYGHGLKTLEQLTGEDRLRFERKYVQAGEPFRYQGMVIIASNQPIATSDKTSAVIRRQVVIPFNKKVSAGKMMDDPEFEAKLEAELPGFLNKLLTIPRDDVKETLRNLPESLALAKLEAEFETNAILSFANEHLVKCSPGEEDPIGTARSEPKYDPHLGRETIPLYPAFIRHCDEHGHSGVIALAKFSRLILDVLGAHGFDTKKIKRPQGGVMIIKGFRIRIGDDDENAAPFLFGLSNQ